MSSAASTLSTLLYDYVLAEAARLGIWVHTIQMDDTIIIYLSGLYESLVISDFVRISYESYDMVLALDDPRLHEHITAFFETNAKPFA